MENKEKWETRFLQMASLVATYSKDVSTQVGCVIANNKNQILSQGYNGFPRGVADDERLLDRDKKYKMILHGEVNAILNTTGDLRGSTAFITHPPCLQCSGMLAQVGVKRVVFVEPSAEFKARWNLEETVEYLSELGIEYSIFRRT